MTVKMTVEGVVVAAEVTMKEMTTMMQIQVQMQRSAVCVAAAAVGADGEPGMTTVVVVVVVASLIVRQWIRWRGGDGIDEPQVGQQLRSP